MHIKLYFFANDIEIIELNIDQNTPPSVQVKRALEGKNIPISELRQIQLEEHFFDDIEQLDDFYPKIEALALYNQTRNKRLLAQEEFHVTPKSPEEALDDFKRNYPKNRLWQLAVDGQLYSTTTGHSLLNQNPEPGWEGYCRRESNSLDAYFSALNSVALSNLEETAISEELILTLHQAVTQDVHLGMNYKIAKGAYREEPPYFSFYPKQGRITESGLTDLLDKIEKKELNDLDENQQGVMLWPKFHNGERCFILPDTIRELREQYVGEGDNLAFAKFLLENCEFIFYQAPIDPQSLVQRTIENYNEKIGGLTDPDDILLLIGQTTEALERIHPFGDANGRTFVNLLQNRLLIQNGFPPATLYEPNVYDVYGHHVEVLKRGILNTLAIYNGENIFGYYLHRRHPLYPKQADGEWSQTHLVHSQAYFDRNEVLRDFSMQYDTNPLLELGEHSPLYPEDVYSLIAFTESVLDKLEYIEEAIKHFAENEQYVACLDQVFNDIAHTLPTPSFTQTASDFDLQELYFQVQSRLRLHQQNPAVIKLSESTEKWDFNKPKEASGKGKEKENAKEKEKEKEKEIQPSPLQPQVTEREPVNVQSPVDKLNPREQAFIAILKNYIDERRAEAHPEKKSKHYKTQFVGIKLGHSAKQKIKAAKKLIALLEGKTLHGEPVQSLDSTDFSALTSSRLGQRTAPYMDIIQRYYKPGLDFDKASGG